MRDFVDPTPAGLNPPMDDVFIIERGETFSVLDRWMKRLGQKNPDPLATKAEIRAVLRAFGKMPPQPESKVWRK